MASTIGGIHGPFVGKLGPIVGSSWKGKFYIKARPKPRKKKRGENEKKNQQKFATTHYWLRPIIDFVREGFKNYSDKTEGFNAAKSYALNHAFTQDKNKNYIFDPSLVLVSHGELQNPADIKVEKSADDVLVFTWNPARQPGTTIYDQVMLLAYDDVNENKSMVLTGEFRSTGTARLPLTKRAGQKNIEFHIYIAFRAHDRSRQSNSVYLGKVKMK